MLDNGGRIYISGDALKPEGFAKAPETVGNRPVNCDIERQITGHVRFDRFGHNTKAGRPADKLTLAFAQKLGSAQVSRPDFDQVAKAPGRLRAAIKPRDGKQAGTVRHAGPMRALTVVFRLGIDGGFHALMLPKRCPKSQYPAKLMHITLINNGFYL
jgi:hypothetical protein